MRILAAIPFVSEREERLLLEGFLLTAKNNCQTTNCSDTQTNRTRLSRSLTINYGSARARFPILFARSSARSPQTSR